jgi:hypothetical protein
MQPHPILGGKPPEKPRETNTVEVLAAVGNMVAGVVALTQTNIVIALVILGVGFLSFLFALRHRIGRFFRERRNRKLDDRMARAALPQLRVLARSFDKLVDPNDEKTLYALLRRAFENYANVFEQLHMPTAHLFSEMLRNVRNRLDDEPANKGQILLVLDEFYTVIGAHSNQWMEPVFRSMPTGVRDMLKPDTRAAVNSYRERYVAFHADFGKFVEDLTASLHDGHLPRQFYVYRPDALS